eukprot:352454-Chlamydomonas_euryale.AAC.19
MWSSAAAPPPPPPPPGAAPQAGQASCQLRSIPSATSARSACARSAARASSTSLSAAWRFAISASSLACTSMSCVCSRANSTRRAVASSSFRSAMSPAGNEGADTGGG